MEKKKLAIEDYFLKVRFVNLGRFDLSSHEKLLYSLIEHWSEEKGYCYAKNDEFMLHLGWKLSKLNDNLKSLKDKGLIKMENENSFLRQIYPCVDYK